MSTPPLKEDILAKVDALLSKRMGLGAARPEAADDFPLLTEVVASAATPPGRSAVESAFLATATGQRGLDALPPAPERLAALIAASLEPRLADLFIRQQTHLEGLIRRVVRDELARDGGARRAARPDKPV